RGAAFTGGLRVQPSAGGARLSQFFTQWFDTAYPAGGQNKPQITGPGLAGPGFYNASGGCSWSGPPPRRVPPSGAGARGAWASRAGAAAPPPPCPAAPAPGATE